jgi:crossover junction endodeoxyribonuclease RuvC
MKGERLRVIGIDPGLTTTGYGIIERTGSELRPVAYGVLRTAPSEPPAVRLAELQEMLAGVLGDFAPDVAAMERLFFNSNVRTAMSVGQASGVMLATLGRAGIVPVMYTPPEVKQSVVGVGNADKRQVQAMTARVLGLSQPPRPADAADACALAICHLNRSGYTQAVATSGGAR